MVSSPTFSIMNIYECNITVNHFDFYRLADRKDLENCGFFDSLDHRALTIVEWPDKFSLDYKIFSKGELYTVDIELGENAGSYGICDKRIITISKN